MYANLDQPLLAEETRSYAMSTFKHSLSNSIRKDDRSEKETKTKIRSRERFSCLKVLEIELWHLPNEHSVVSYV